MNNPAPEEGAGYEPEGERPNDRSPFFINASNVASTSPSAREMRTTSRLIARAKKERASGTVREILMSGLDNRPGLILCWPPPCAADRTGAGHFDSAVPSDKGRNGYDD